MALLVFTDIVNSADMRMIDARCSARFSPESFKGNGIRCKVIGQELESYFASQPDIFRAVDHAHASTAEMRDDSVMGDGTAEHRFAGSIAQAVAPREPDLGLGLASGLVSSIECRLFCPAILREQSSIMDVHLTALSEKFVNEQLARGAFRSPEQVIERALEVLRCENEWLHDHRDLIRDKIERAFGQFENGEFLSAEESRADMEQRKNAWLSEHKR
jgi:hypothetical protein